jgi:hypothetical protein
VSSFTPLYELQLWQHWFPRSLRLVSGITCRSWVGLLNFECTVNRLWDMGSVGNVYEPQCKTWMSLKRNVAILAAAHQLSVKNSCIEFFGNLANVLATDIWWQTDRRACSALGNALLRSRCWILQWTRMLSVLEACQPVQEFKIRVERSFKSDLFCQSNNDGGACRHGVLPPRDTQLLTLRMMRRDVVWSTVAVWIVGGGGDASLHFT